MRLPSWNEFVDKLDKFKTDLSDKVSEFKKDHPQLSKAIETSFLILPPPFNFIARDIFHYVDGSLAEKRDQVLHYFEYLKSQGQKHYDQIAIKLDNVLADIDDVKQLTAKETTLQHLQEILVSRVDVVDQKIDLLNNDLKRIEVKVDVINETTKETNKRTQTTNQMITELKSELGEYFKTGKEELTKLQIPSQTITGQNIVVPQSAIINIDNRNTEIEKLVEELKKLNQEPEVDIEYLLKSANAYYYNRQYDKAKELYEKILSFEPNNIQALYNKGNALAKLGRYEEAFSIYDAIVQMDPRNVDALTNMGNVLTTLEKYKAAISVYDKALEFDSKNILALNKKGIALHKVGNSKKAIECFDKVLKMDHQEINALSNKAMVMKEIGKRKKAIPIYKEILKIDPNNTEAVENLGISLKNKKRKFSWFNRRKDKDEPEKKVKKKPKKESHIEGIVRDFMIFEETRGFYIYQVWRFRVERYDQDMNILAPVSVEMRGQGFEGFINNGDKIRIDQKWKEGLLLKPKKVYNITNGIWVKNRGDVFGAAWKISGG